MTERVVLNRVRQEEGGNVVYWFENRSKGIVATLVRLEDGYLQGRIRTPQKALVIQYLTRDSSKISPESFRDASARRIQDFYNLPKRKEFVHYHQTGRTNVPIDRKRRAKPAGARISASGKRYIEYRKNRSDNPKTRI
jgi:hypothetical protein